MLGTAIAVGVHSVPMLVLAWGLAGTAAALAGLAQTRLIPKLGTACAWLRVNRDLNTRFVGEFLAIIATVQGLTFSVVFIAGLAAAGAFQAGQLLMGPVVVIVLSAGLIGVPELSRRINAAQQDPVRLAALLSAAAVTATAVWIACAALLPDSVGRALLGESWGAARHLLLPLSVWALASAAMTGASSGLRAFGAARSTVKLRLATGAISLASGIPLIALSGAVGAASAWATGFVIMLPLWWQTLKRTARAQAVTARR